MQKRKGEVFGKMNYKSPHWDKQYAFVDSKLQNRTHAWFCWIVWDMFWLTKQSCKNCANQAVR